MSRTYRWYILEHQPSGKYRITGWARTKEAAASKRPANGFVVYAGDRQQAARRASQWWGVDVDWKKFEVWK